jgi:hypothetical protein
MGKKMLVGAHQTWGKKIKQRSASRQKRTDFGKSFACSLPMLTTSGELSSNQREEPKSSHKRHVQDRLWSYFAALDELARSLRSVGAGSEELERRISHELVAACSAGRVREGDVETLRRSGVLELLEAVRTASGK